MPIDHLIDKTDYVSQALIQPNLKSDEPHSNPTYYISNTQVATKPVMKCQYVRGFPCPANKTSYWRSFAMNVKDGGCGEPKRICGASRMPSYGPPHYTVEPLLDPKLMKFF